MAVCLRESAMDTVDESVGLVELPPQLGALPAMKRCPAHRDTTITLGFYPLQLRDISTRYSSNDPSISRACAVDASSTMTASSQSQFGFARRDTHRRSGCPPVLPVDRCPFLPQASVMAEISEDLLIAEVKRRLTSKYAHIPAVEVSTAIQRVYAQFEQSPIRDFVPLLVERRAGAELAKQKEPVAASL
jgi:hypothetical protein